jgi:hypothetical protein
MKLPKILMPSRQVRLGVASAAAVGLLVALPSSAQAAVTPVPLGTAASFVVLAGSGITNTGPTTLDGDIGTFPTKSITGAGSLTVSGANPASDTATTQAKADLVVAMTAAAAEGPSSPIVADLTGQRLTKGVYNSASSIQLTGELTLDGQGDPNAVFVFQAGSSLTTGEGSRVTLIGLANPCNVFWQVGSSATIGTGSNFVGTIMALDSITLVTNARIDGRALASVGKVTLDSNTISNRACRASTTPVPTATATATATATQTAQVTAVPAGPVRTGDGSTSGKGTGGNHGLALLTGALTLAGVGGASVVAARRRRVNI